MMAARLQSVSELTLPLERQHRKLLILLSAASFKLRFEQIKQVTTRMLALMLSHRDPRSPDRGFLLPPSVPLAETLVSLISMYIFRRIPGFFPLDFAILV